MIGWGHSIGYYRVAFEELSIIQNPSYFVNIPGQSLLSRNFPLQLPTRRGLLVVGGRSDTNSFSFLCAECSIAGWQEHSDFVPGMLEILAVCRGIPLVLHEGVPNKKSTNCHRQSRKCLP